MFQGAIYNLNHKNHSNTNGQARNEPRPCSLRWLGGTEVTTSILEVTQTLKGTAGADSLTFTHPSNLRFLSSQAPSHKSDPCLRQVPLPRMKRYNLKPDKKTLCWFSVHFWLI